MKTCDLFKKKTVLSFEVFPPKRTDAVDTVYSTVAALKELTPDFISVTYGAGGGRATCDATLSIASAIKYEYGIESVAHLPCIGLTKEEATNQLERFKAAGIENILALRGDIPEGGAPSGDFAHASDLISFIRERYDFNLIAACYPEGHNESESVLADIHNLKIKTDAGATQLISQLFFDNDYFYRFLERCRLANIDVPIEAGIMPVANKKQIERMVTLCGVTLPKKFVATMTRYEDNP